MTDIMSEIRLSIIGMSCAGCVASVEDALNKVNGVDKASVNFADHTANIVGNASVESLIKSVVDAGYDATELTSSDANQVLEKEQQDFIYYQQLLRKSLAAALIGIPLFVASLLGILPAIEGITNQLFWLAGRFGNLIYHVLFGRSFLYWCYKIIF